MFENHLASWQAEIGSFLTDQESLVGLEEADVLQLREHLLKDLEAPDVSLLVLEFLGYQLQLSV